jgi:hypothetical protein
MMITVESVPHLLQVRNIGSVRSLHEKAARDGGIIIIVILL